MSKSKFFASILLFSICTIMFGTITVFAAVNFISDALWYKQERTNWCWAAVTETIIDKETSGFTKGSYKSRQERIVATAKGNIANVTGNTDDMIKAMKAINSSAFRNSTWDYILGSSDFSKIMNEILNDDVVGVNLYNAKPPYFTGQSLKGHSTYAYWVDTSKNNILLGDPWSTNQYIDVYRDALLNTGIECHAFPGIKVYGGIYLIY